MPVKVLKKKAVKVGEKNQLSQKEIADSVDAGSVLFYKIKEHKKVLSDLQEELAKINDRIFELVADHLEDADAKLKLSGKAGTTLKISAKANTRVVDDNAKEAIYGTLETIQDGLGLSLMQFRLGDLDKYLTPEQVEEVVLRDRGARRFTYD